LTAGTGGPPGTAGTIGDFLAAGIEIGEIGDFLVAGIGAVGALGA
jgi:hypothetical protein